MGAVFFITLLPIILTVLAIVFVMAIIGIVIFVVGIGGSIVSAAAISNKKIKRVSLYFFLSLLLLGLSCLFVLGGIYFSVYFFILPMLIAVGIIVVALDIIGITAAFSIEKTPAKITLVILLSLAAIIGGLVLAVGLFMLVLG